MKHFNFSVNTTIVFALGFSALALCSVASYGEGGEKRPSGDHGINRRVITQTGYTEVGGTFDVEYGMPVNSDGTLPVGGTANDRPSVYLGAKANTGGSSYDIDSGLQCDPIKGWNYFQRNSTPSALKLEPLPGFTPANNGQTYSQPSYWDGTKSVNWQAPTKNPITDTMSFQLLQNNPSTPGVDEAGWFGLTVKAWPVGEQTVYWLGQRVANTSPPAPYAAAPPLSTKQMIVSHNVTNPPGVVPAPNPAIAVGAFEFYLDSVDDLEESEDMMVDGEKIQIGNIDKANKKITLKKSAGVQSQFARSHNLPSSVSQTILFGKAYPDHKAAPWRGNSIFDSNLSNGTLNLVRVKRVIAMTRLTPGSAGALPNEEDLDGSWLDCTFSGGYVKPYNAVRHTWGSDTTIVR